MKKLRNLPNPLFLLPILRFTVHEESMLPTFKPGEDIFVWRWGSPKIGDVVVLNNSASHYHTLTYNSVAFLVKRVKEIKNDKYFVVGDNEQASTDSRKFGWVERKEIVGVVIK